MKSRRWTSIASIALAAALAGAARGQTPGPAGTAQCGDEAHPASCAAVVVAAPNAALRLAVANTFALREHGLMFRTALAPHTGMLFVFPSEAKVEFWMKNTLIPLDMVFVDRRGVVTTVAADVPATKTMTPDAQIPRRSGRALYVLELPAGEAASDGLHAGAQVRIPSVSASE